MSKGKRGKKARLGQPHSGDYKGRNPYEDKIKFYKWTEPCKLCKRLGQHDPDCRAYVHKA